MDHTFGSEGVTFIDQNVNQALKAILPDSQFEKHFESRKNKGSTSKREIWFVAFVKNLSKHLEREYLKRNT